MGLVKHYRKDETGQMAVVFALVLGLIFMVIGAAVDMSALTSAKSKASDLADGMALAGALAAREGKSTYQRTLLGEEGVYAIFEENVLSKDLAVSGLIVAIDDRKKEVRVTFDMSVDYSLMGMFGKKSSNVRSTAVVGYSIDTIPPISMAFAFDTSGSMAWPADGAASKTKMEVLQEATELLFEAMESEAENPDLLRAAFTTTFSSYNTDIVAREGWSFGGISIDNVKDYANEMVALGGTNSVPSMQYAVDQLIGNRPFRNPKWQGYVLFMTDGSNNNAASENPDTLALCEQLKSDPLITVITVAFSAPQAGQDLLEECATEGNYYESKDARQIKKDFAKIGREIGEATIRLKG